MFDWLIAGKNHLRILNNNMKEKQIRLSALDLEVSIPESINFYDDGFVDNIREHADFLRFKYTGTVNADESKPISDRVFGLTQVFGSSDSSHYAVHIFYLRDISPLHARGHEETHFLHLVKRLPYLSEAMKIRQGIEIDLDSLKTEITEVHKKRELIADLGGIFALSQRNGWDGVRNFQLHSQFRSEHFDEAFFIYFNAREKSLQESKKQAQEVRRIFYL